MFVNFSMDKIKLSYCVFLYLFLGYINSFIASNISLPQEVHSKLFDVGHYYFPKISALYPDILFFSIFIYFIIRWHANHRLLKVFFLICSILFLIRLIIFPITQFPPAYSLEDCFKPLGNGPWIFFTFYSQSTCVDYMFSGHTFHLTIITLLTIYNSGNYFEKVLLPLVAIVNVMIIIAARMHYTSDIVVGFIISFLTYSIYELYMKNRFLNRLIDKQNKNNNN